MLKEILGAMLIIAAVLALGAIIIRIIIDRTIRLMFGRLREDSEKTQNGKTISQCVGAFAPYLEHIRKAGEALRDCADERLRIKSDEGFELVGHLATVENAERVIIAAHGFHSTWLADMGSVADYFRRARCNVIYIEQRTHGESEGDYLSFGVFERFDIQKWAALAAERFPGLPLYLYGISMGAASVMMASPLELPASTRAIIADCGYSTVDGVISHVIENDAGIKSRLLIRLIDKSCRRIARFSFFDCSSTDSLAQTKLPLLIIHGEKDSFVPVSMAHDNFEACASQKQLELFGEAGHGLSYLSDTPKYEKILNDFFKRWDTDEIQ